MSPAWIWGGAVLFYAAFSLWYNNWRGPLSAAEIDVYMKRFEASSDDRGSARRDAVRAFFEADDGGEFFMLNLIRLFPDPVKDPDTGEPRPARDVLGEYTGYFMPALFRRAGHPAFLGPAAARYLEEWGVEADPGWTFSGIVRYRSRRDMAELATNPAFDPAHAYKIAAMSNTLAFPVSPATLFFGPRVWVALVLALLASLSHLTLRTFSST